MKKLIIPLFLILLIPLALALDLNTDGPIPEFTSLFLSNGSRIDANVDFSAKPQNFTAGPPSDEVWRISRMLLTIIDANIVNVASYGAIAGGLTNGLEVGVIQDGIIGILNPERNISDGMFKIRSNGDWASLMFDVEITNLGSGDDYVTGRWTFDKAGTKIRLDGATNDTIFIEFSDDMSGLEAHRFLLQGYIERTTEDTTMPIAIILTVIFVIGVYFFILVRLITERQFTEHGLIKLLFYLIAFWVILLPLNMAVQFNDANGGPTVVTDHLNLLYQIIIWLNWFIMFYFMLWFMVQMLKKLGNSKLSNEEKHG